MNAEPKTRAAGRIVRFAGPVLLLGALAMFSSFGFGSLSAAEKSRAIPPPAVDQAAASGSSEVAVLAGGCFWGVQGVYQHVEGVSSAVSGYAGGEAATARYETVSSGTTGRAEAVRST